MRGWTIGALLLCVGCGERDAMDPGSISREMTMTAPKKPASVRCACDADGGLHVAAPENARVTAVGPGEAEIGFVDDDPRPIRRVRSLGFIGDNKLGESRGNGGDALLPPHAHSSGDYGSYGVYGSYGRYGYGRPSAYAPRHFRR
jgi:hypothetical protein